MAFHKPRALQEAEKLVAQGKIAQAIKQYQYILDNDPSDVSLFNTIGDLYIRDRNVTEGLRHFHELAEAYVRGGFNVKAIAIYRKIAKLDPNTLETFVKLAELYQLQGLNREAREQYLQVAELFKKRKQTDRLLQVLQRLVHLDPESMAFRSRLAAEYEQSGQREEAARTYLESAQILLCREDQAAADAALKKAAELNPNHPTIQMLRAGVAISRQDPAEAERIITSSRELRSDPAGKRILLDSYLGTGKLAEAGKLVLEMFQANTADFAPVSSVSARMVEKGEIEQAHQLLAGVAEQMVSRNNAHPLLDALRLIWNNAPDHIPTLELIHQICERTADELTLPEVLEALGRIHEKAGDLEKAEAAYLKLFERQPVNEYYRGLLNAVEQKLGKEPKPAGLSSTETALAEEARPQEPTGIDPAQQAMVNDALENSDLYARYNLTEQAIAELEKLLQVYPNQIDIHRRIIEISRKGYPARAAMAAAQLARIFADRGDEETAAKYRAIASGTVSIPEFPLTPVPAMEGEPPAPTPPIAPGVAEGGTTAIFPASPSAAEPAASGPIAAPEKVSTDVTPTEAVSESPVPPPPSPVPPEHKTEWDLSDDLEAIAGAGDQHSAPEPAAAGPATPRLPVEVPAAANGLALQPIQASREAAGSASARTEDLTPIDLQDSRIEIDFYLEHGFRDEARQAVAALEEKYPGNAIVAELRRLLTEREAARDHPEPQAPVAPSSAPVEPEVPETKQEPVVGETVSAGIGSVDTPGTWAADFAVPIEALTAPAGAVQAPHASADAGPARAAAAPAAPIPASADAAGGVVQLRGLLEDLEEPFGMAITANDDPETHYNLGVAFREMGLLDEAIGEFQKLVRSAGKDSFPPNFLQVCSLLAICFMEKKMPMVAAKWYTRALETPGLDEDAIMALQYDLGVAYEQAGDSRSALERFTEVIGQNIDFRDVAEKVRYLKQKV
jgi:tetratricopeptide (TPR) repeat protein